MKTNLLKILAAVCCVTTGVAWGADYNDEDGVRSVVYRQAAVAAFSLENPSARFFEHAGRVTNVYGAAFAHGMSPEDSAEEFVQNHIEMFGVPVVDLNWSSPLADGRHTQPIMFNQDTGDYKFTLVYYTQERAGVPVFRSDVRLLVRNEPGFPLVLAVNSLRDLGAFNAPATAVQQPQLGQATAQMAFPAMTHFTQPELIIWAGVDGIVVPATLAFRFVGTEILPIGAVADKWLFVADAATGRILYQEDLILEVDVEGNVSALASNGPGADICEDEILTPMPYAEVSISGGATVFADANGDFVIPNAGSSEVTVNSPVKGQYFRITNFGAAGNQPTELSMQVTPPGPADFLHNEANADEFFRAEVNAYVEANAVRDTVLAFNPAYPTVAGQLNYELRVSQSSAQSGGFCPGNAQYLGDALRFCRSGGSSPNTAWSSVVHHEYGHHLVAMAGSGQGAYGEGTGDVMSVLVLDDARLGLGFFGNCNSSLRNAVNNCQYTSSGCSSCGSAIHTCGTVMSGCVWETRNELLITNPDTYLSIIRNLAINAILLHGPSTSITPAITVHYLTLDDDDDTIDNGTPHYFEIAAGFAEHSMDAPELALLAFVYPDGQPEFSDPNNGAEIVVEIQAVSGALDPDETPQLNVSVDGGPFTATPLSSGGGNLFSGFLPPADCFATISWYISAQDIGGFVVTSPAGAPANTFEALVGTGSSTTVTLDFEDDPGFAITGDATDGQWGRGIPVDCNRGDPPTDFDGSGQCWLTDNGTQPDCNTDVDGGSTTLITTPFDMSDPNVSYSVSYARWYSNTFGASPNADVFVIDVSNDDGGTWTNLETVGPTGPEVDGGWFHVTHNVNAVVDPTVEMRLRFTASDLGAGSVIEAGIDALSIKVITCESEDLTPPSILHDDGATTHPFSGYVDPRKESTDGNSVDLGINEVDIRFSEMVAAIGGGFLTPASFSVTGTGGNLPTVIGVDASQSPLVHLTLSGDIPIQHWTTIIADVEDLAGNVIENNGDQGPEVDESDRVDIGYLPADVDQSGQVTPLDLLRFKQLINDIVDPDQGTEADFLDLNRDGTVNPLDLLVYKQLINGVGTATQSWAGTSLPTRP